MHVLIIGPRASGKTSVGRWLAAHLDRPFVDLDDRALAQFAQTTVADVFEQLGEDAWRAAEVAALNAVLPEDAPHILALGGGTPMIESAQRCIEHEQSRGRAFVVYLRTDPVVLRQRLAAELGDRPSLTGNDPIEEVEQIVAQRAPTYEALAELICDTDERSTDEIGGIIAAELHRHHG